MTHQLVPVPSELLNAVIPGLQDGDRVVVLDRQPFWPLVTEPIMGANPLD